MTDFVCWSSKSTKKNKIIVAKHTNIIIHFLSRARERYTWENQSSLWPRCSYINQIFTLQNVQPNPLLSQNDRWGINLSVYIDYQDHVHVSVINSLQSLSVHNQPSWPSLSFSRSHPLSLEEGLTQYFFSAKECQPLNGKTSY